MAKNIIIAFLLGMLCMNLAYGLKVPDIILPTTVNAEVREILEDYVIQILNRGKYVMNVFASEVTSATDLSAGEFLFDDSAVNKYLVISNGTNNYRVQLTQL